MTAHPSIFLSQKSSDLVGIVLSKEERITQGLKVLFENMDPGGLVFIFTEAPTKNLELAEALIKTKIRCIHSKSEPHDPNGAAKKFELSANLSKYATKWPKNDPKCPKVAQI